MSKVKAVTFVIVVAAVTFLVVEGVLPVLVAAFEAGAQDEQRSSTAIEKAEELPRTVKVEAVATGYCPCEKCCGRFADGITANGRSVEMHPYGIAADPLVLPYGAKIDVPGYGRAEVDDTGAAMSNSEVPHVDLRFKTHDEALEWGRRDVILEVSTVNLVRDQIESLLAHTLR